MSLEDDIAALVKESMNRQSEREFMAICGTTATAGAHQEALTFAKLEEMMQLIQPVIAAPVVNVYESDMAGTMQQTRRYPRRKAKSEAHYRRMNKKWLKRYGKHIQPGIFEMDMGALGFGRQERALFVHPALMVKFRASCNARAEPSK